MSYSIVIEPRALLDIQQAIDYYDDKQINLGERFLKSIEKHFSSISLNPFFQVRYASVRCLPVKNYPFMIHFTVDENTRKVFIITVLHTSMNPENWIKS